ncbi:MAG: peptidase M14 [Bacteroidia bacterium]|nr:peptidase M14 [Bacteroidia bacterium]
MPVDSKISELILRLKEPSLFHRYITHEMIAPLLEKYQNTFHIESIGTSVEGRPIHGIKVGKGPQKVLMWSQMHGNESTTTKAIFDLLKGISDKALDTSLESCQLYIIPILNPDGAYLYTRHNANDIDLNRDAQEMSQPESQVLRKVFDEFKPDFCFNLHGQRTIFSAGKVNKPATLSFLAPAQDKDRSLTENRKKAMAIIVTIHKELQNLIPDQIGIYNDDFNINCVGDSFQSQNVPTLLFEAGHFELDYEREIVRKYMLIAIVTALRTIGGSGNDLSDHSAYFQIPGNEKLFYDILIRDVKLEEDAPSVDIAIQYQEVLIDSKVEFIPKIEKIKPALKKFAHRTIFGNHNPISNAENKAIVEGNEIDFVVINNKKYSLKTDKR